MPRRRFQELPVERREQLLQAAAKEFAQHGYDGASLNHILAAAGVSKGAAYYYFDDKADLFATVGRHYLEHVMGHVAIDFATLDAASFWAKIRALYQTLQEHTREEPWLLGVTKAMWSLSSQARGDRILAPLWDWARGWLRQLIERGQVVGVVRRDVPVDLVIDLILAIDTAVDRHVLSQGEALGEEGVLALMDRVLDMAARMLAPPAGTP